MTVSRVPELGLRAQWLADAELRSNLERFVRRRLRGDEASDVVQATIADALASNSAPDDAEGFRRFVYAIARNKVVDHYRRNVRELPDEEVADVAAAHDPVSARDLLRWAEEELPSSDDKDTLEWMLREADGDKLEHIAEEAKLPAPRVRQRVSRLRRYLRRRWAAQLAAAGVVGLLLAVGYYYWQEQKAPPVVQDGPVERARKLRHDALERCKARDYRPCLRGLDEARALDPAGDSVESVRAARREAERALTPVPVPTPTNSVVPAPSAEIDTPAPPPVDTAEAKPPAPPNRAPKDTADEKPLPPPKPAPRKRTKTKDGADLDFSEK